MDKNQRILVYLLSIAIRGGEVDRNKIANVDWKVILETAKMQQIYTLIYPVIKNLDENVKPNNQIMSQWKKQTILTGVLQMQNSNKIGSVLRRFKLEKIQVIALKGVILRNFYPVKEFRTMGDTDLLIHAEDFDSAKRLLILMGYAEGISGIKDTKFVHEKFIPIELHWLPIDTNYFKHAQYIEKNIWKKTENFSMCGVNILVPSLENQLLHLLIHMVVHFTCSGFGLRQLCDLILLVEAKRNELDWNSFDEIIKECKIEDFVVSIFEVCRRLFCLVIPENLYDEKLADNIYIDMIIFNVFSGGVFKGVYGKTKCVLVDKKLVPYYKNKGYSENFIEKLKYLINLFSPMPLNFNKRYNYVRKYHILLPIAWIHRGIYSIIYKRYRKYEKKDILFLNLDKMKQRTELFKWLNIRG